MTWKRWLLIAGLILSVSFLSAANTFLLLLAGLFLVRFFGQGLMTHTSSTGIAKLFDKERGKALAFTSLGHPFAQLILPFLFVFLTGIFNWRLSFILLATLSLLIMLPLIFHISPEGERKDDPSDGAEKEGGSHFLLSRRFWQIAVNIFVIPFLSTAIMLYQYTISESKGAVCDSFPITCCRRWQDLRHSTSGRGS